LAQFRKKVTARILLLSWPAMMEVTEPLQERARRTRSTLLVAAAEVLVDCGLAGCTTAAVAEAAGCSQGALFKHFPTRALLLAHTVQSTLDALVEGFDDAIRAAPKLPKLALEDRVRLAIATLWAIFRSDELRAVFEVFVAARTDPALEELLAPVLERHSARIHAEALRLFPEVARHPEATTIVDGIVLAMQGAAVGLFGQAARDDHKNLAFFERLALRELAYLAAGAPRKRTKKAR
jgi:AcrR family transcriptional regulator